MADIYQITTPNGTTYNLKDKWARDEIANIQSAIAGGVTFMGQTTTELTDGATTSTIVINGNNVTAERGYLVVTQQYDIQPESSVYKTITLTYQPGQTITYYTGAVINNSSITLTGQETATVTQASGGWVFLNLPETYYDSYQSNPCKVTWEVATAPSTGWTFKYYKLNIVQLSGYGKEFVYDGTKWIELGDLNALGDLAWVDMASADYTPAGIVSQPTFSGSEMTSSGSYTKYSYSLMTSQASGEGAVNVTPTTSTKSFSGTAATIKPKVTAAGTVEISTGTGTANYTPAGNVSAPTISVATAGSTTTVNSITNVGTLPTLTTSVANENLTISFSQGTLPTKGANTTVKTGDASYTASAPSFTGTGTELKATFTGTEVEGSASYTPAGTVNLTFQNKYLFLGRSDVSDTVTVTGTPSGTVSQPTFSGTQATITVAPST